METTLAPAAYRALGWGPAETSMRILFGTNATTLVMMFVVMLLSKYRVAKDEVLLASGLILSIGSYSLLWAWWVDDAPVWQFILPIGMSAMTFPLLAPANRSLYTRAVDDIDLLDGHEGTMQSVLSMAASVAGFATPGLIAAFVLRRPSEVEQSRHHRELTRLALVAPGLSALVLLGLFLRVFWERRSTTEKRRKKKETPTTGQGMPIEATEIPTTSSAELSFAAEDTPLMGTRPSPTLSSRGTSAMHCHRLDDGIRCTEVRDSPQLNGEHNHHDCEEYSNVV